MAEDDGGGAGDVDTGGFSSYEEAMSTYDETVANGENPWGASRDEFEDMASQAFGTPGISAEEASAANQEAGNAWAAENGYADADEVWTDDSTGDVWVDGHNVGNIGDALTSPQEAKEATNPGMGDLLNAAARGDASAMAQMSGNIAGAMSNAGRGNASQTQATFVDNLAKAGVSRSDALQIAQAATGRGTSQWAQDQRQAAANIFNGTRNSQQLADLLGISVREADALLTDPNGLDKAGEIINNDSRARGPTDPAAQALYAALTGEYPPGTNREQADAFARAYAEEIAKGTNPAQAYDRALGVSGIAPTREMNDFIKNAAINTAGFLAGAGIARAGAGLGASLNNALTTGRLGNWAGIVQWLGEHAVAGRDGVSILESILDLAPDVGAAIWAAAQSGATLQQLQDMIDSARRSTGSGTDGIEAGREAARNTANNTPSLGTGASSASNPSGASTASSNVSGTTAPSNNTEWEGSRGNYNPFDPFVPDLSGGNQANAAGYADQLGSGTTNNTDSVVESAGGNTDNRSQNEWRESGVGEDLSNSDNSDNGQGNTVGGTGGNPNAGGSETTEGVVKDKNGGDIDFNVNSDRIGFSDDPNKANYDDNDAKRWNRGMEDTSLNVVSDEACKRFISSTFGDDPVMQGWARKIIEIQRTPHGIITKEEVIE